MRGLLPEPDESEKPLGTVPDAPDWRLLDSKLAEARYWTPQQIDSMTLPEIRAICMESPTADWAQIELFKNLDPEQRLDLAIYQRDRLKGQHGLR